MYSYGYTESRPNCKGCILERENEVKEQVGGLALVRILSIDKKSWLELKEVLANADRNVPIMDRGRRNILIEIPSNEVETVEELEVVNGCDSFIPLTSVVLLNPTMTRTLLMDAKNLRRVDVIPATTKDNVVPYGDHVFVGISVNKPHNYVGRFVFHCGMKDGSKKSFGTIDFKIVSREYYFKDEERLCMLPKPPMKDWSHNDNCEITKAMFRSVKRPRRRTLMTPSGVHFAGGRVPQAYLPQQMPGDTIHPSLMEAVSQVSQDFNQGNPNVPNGGFPNGGKPQLPQQQGQPTAIPTNDGQNGNVDQPNGNDEGNANANHPNVDNTGANTVGDIQAAPAATSGPMPSTRPTPLASNGIGDANKIGGGRSYYSMDQARNMSQNATPMRFTPAEPVNSMRGSMYGGGRMVNQGNVVIQQMQIAKRLYDELAKGPGASASVIENIFSTPGSINLKLQTRPGEGKRNILHVSLQHGVGPDVIKVVLDGMPAEYKYAQDQMGKTPLHIACEGKETKGESVDALIAGTPPSVRMIKDNCDRTCLHYAATYHPEPAVVTALMNKATPDFRVVKDGFGQTAIDYAFATNAPMKMTLELMRHVSPGLPNLRTLVPPPLNLISSNQHAKETALDIATEQMKMLAARSTWLLDPVPNASTDIKRLAEFVRLCTRCAGWMGVFEDEDIPEPPQVDMQQLNPLNAMAGAIPTMPVGINGIMPFGMAGGFPALSQFVAAGQMPVMPGIMPNQSMPLPGFQKFVSDTTKQFQDPTNPEGNIAKQQLPQFHTTGLNGSQMNEQI
eukprot:TRINITY_DN15212_c0_g1_i1.p1 TRINITY_DN15212_c0_g1~~TRINITY_DN15212_c0_g1_i1.p1  ORF type:complete len:788 (+),score=276.16 TRINITY_DN15212_c0_g1_i1:149-2512(+)